jgi:cysteinyl-tRNA synthetase, unknown class
MNGSGKEKRYPRARARIAVAVAGRHRIVIRRILDVRTRRHRNFPKGKKAVYHAGMSTSLGSAGNGLLALFAALFLSCTGARLATPLSEVRSWAFQLQNVDPVEIKLSPYDLVVIDYGFDRRNATAFPREVVDLMRRRSGGRARLILAYLSVGEAENYRYYWQDNWRTLPPQWLRPENPEWPGNYLVEYWDPGWQAILYGSPNAYLDRILAAGFDGVYLDGVDKFEQWMSTRASAASDMVDLVRATASYARAHRSDFLIIPQNGDRLLDNARFVETIDGFAREDLLYNETEDQARNAPESILESVQRMRPLIAAGKPILVIEYTSDPQLAASALRELKQLGLIGYVTRRDLRTLSPPAFGCGQPDCSQ